MRIRHCFWLWAVWLLAIGVCAWGEVWSESASRRAGVALTVGALAYLGWFYRKAVKPWRTIENGMSLLNEQDFSSRLSPVGQYEADHVVAVFNRMMQQLKGERLRLREQNQFLDLLFQASPMGILVFDLDNRLSSLNPCAERLLGVPQSALVGRRLADMDLGLARELALLDTDGTQTVRLSDSTVYKCTRSSFLDRGARHPFMLIEPLTGEVMRAEKKAYEKVIRMISHEVNNTVAGVTSTLDTLTMALEDTPDTDDVREVMRVCVERCFGMSRFITNFADVVKIPDPQLKVEDLNEVVRANLQFMEVVCRQRRIRITTAYAAHPVRVRLDAALFQQVLINIIKNAAESIGEEGEIRIATRHDLPMLEVADNGAGIDAASAPKLFTPFFSTKPAGQGIGLMFIREVLMKHGCKFSLRTGNDGWTRFRIAFVDERVGGR